MSMSLLLYKSLFLLLYACFLILMVKLLEDLCLVPLATT